MRAFRAAPRPPAFPGALILTAALCLLATGCGTEPGGSARGAAATGTPATAPSGTPATAPSGAPAPIRTEPVDIHRTPYGTDPSAPAGSPGPCPASGLRMAMGQPDAAMGLRVERLTVTNCGRAVKTLAGYPRLRLLGADREPLDVRILRGTSAIAGGVRDEAPRSFTLRPGESLHASLAWRNTYQDTSKPPVNAAYVEAAAVAGAQPEVVRPTAPIDLGSTGRLGRSAWYRAPGESAAPR
ncbi:DUF4232 domain-containing protein [Streptomyces sp. SCSIO ZS0520]|uniref:DUF4232 domain-containing protein n=1 Tax=Streptomyces sp. SCSIO ZS0520 TaxID=2892996 RepID=UPI0021D8AA5C|nr:DUF4232 domain-containing protein [Streptomyces sp. SCSIO ZS0520]